MSLFNLYKSLISPLIVLLLLGALFLLGLHPDLSTILGGIALFLLGMEYMENGFKAFSGSLLEKVLERFTHTAPRAISTGFFATALVQSSSLISIIVISFLSAELITLTSAIGVIFGSNIGTTATAWLVALFGLKIKISLYAMPMIIMGILIPLFSKESSWRGIASISIGLGIVFLGIGYMKEGFETLKEGINLAQYAMAGYGGIFLYVVVGTVATMVIQSSSATMAIIITALAAGQIDYTNALALAIGANVGTTVTAVLGALKSNENGKRLAMAHFIFNIVTGVIAILFIYQLTDLVDYLALWVGIAQENYTIKLALFHTVFNLIGVLTVSPFIAVLVKFLHTLFIPKGLSKGKPKYLDDSVLLLPSTALSAIVMETKHLYKNASEIIMHGLNLRKKHVLSSMDLDEVVMDSYTRKSINIDLFYNRWIKEIYSEIIDFSTRGQANMPPEYIEALYKLKLANKDIVEAIKDTKHLQKNLLKYTSGHNRYIKAQYNSIRKGLTKLLRTIHTISKMEEEEHIISLLSKAKTDVQQYDIIANGTLDELIRKNLITNRMATSLMNDSGYAYSISQNLISMAQLLFIEINKDLKQLHKESSIGITEENLLLEKE